MTTLLIDSEWCAGAGGTADVVNPYDGTVAGQVDQGSADQALAAAAAAKAHQSDLTAYDRAEILAATAARIEAEAEDFVTSICRESGLTVKDGRKEVGRAVGLLRFCAEEAKRITGESMLTDVNEARLRNFAATLREPIGLVCAITPFNRPLNQVVVKLAPAIAANCSIVLKPSEKTPLTGIKFVQTLIDCGLPPAMIGVVTGDPREIGDALVSSADVDMITFTGSSAVGEHIARTCGMIRTAFELGDAGALIVLEDADLAAAAKAAAAGAYSTAGQSCRGVKRILVAEQVGDAFVDLLKTETEKLVVGDPMDPATDIGALISEQAAIAVERRVDDAVAAGAELVHGGQRDGAQYWPTVIDRVDRADPLVAEETFGPCAPIIRITDMDDAIDCTNGTAFGLQTGVFTRDIGRAMQAARALKVGAVIINGGPQFESPNIPFGGVKKSGLGREGVKYAIQEMTVVKTIVF